jgi:protein-tyrosine-phosphatase
MTRVYNVLFLCTGNTARSVLAEGILRKDGAGRFNAFSAGSQPKRIVNPFALKVLSSYGYPTDGFRSKSWDEFAEADAPEMDFVFTVCDSAAGETCPFWPGQPMTAHWGIEDPAASKARILKRKRHSSPRSNISGTGFRISSISRLAASTPRRSARAFAKLGKSTGQRFQTRRPVDGEL